MASGAVVIAEGTATFAFDEFERTIVNGMGTSETGYEWDAFAGGEVNCDIDGESINWSRPGNAFPWSLVADTTLEEDLAKAGPWWNDQPLQIVCRFKKIGGTNPRFSIGFGVADGYGGAILHCRSREIGVTGSGSQQPPGGYLDLEDPVYQWLDDEWIRCSLELENGVSRVKMWPERVPEPDWQYEADTDPDFIANQALNNFLTVTGMVQWFPGVRAFAGGVAVQIICDWMRFQSAGAAPVVISGR